MSEETEKNINEDINKDLNEYETAVMKVLQPALGGDMQGAFSLQKGKPEYKLDVFFAKGSPKQGFITACTLGLINRTTGFDYENKKIRSEILMSSHDNTDYTGRILTSIGLKLLESGVQYGYGTVICDVMELYYPLSDMKHVVFVTPPPSFGGRFVHTECNGEIIAFLYAMVISDKEKEYMNKNGIPALMQVLGENNADFYDLDRISVL